MKPQRRRCMAREHPRRPSQLQHDSCQTSSSTAAAIGAEGREERGGASDGDLVPWHMFHLHLMRCGLKDPTTLLPGPVPPELLAGAYRGNVKRPMDSYAGSGTDFRSGPDVAHPTPL
ncbi:MAG: hypothetical protein WDW38_003771 [Sanguina aurantia]